MKVVQKNVMCHATRLWKIAEIKMKFDDIDISILFYLLDNPTQTTSHIAKKIFECKETDIRKYDSLTRLRLQEMEKNKIVIHTPTSPKTYTVNPECVFCGTGELRINANGGGIIRLKFGDFLVITDNKEYLQVNRIERKGDNKSNVEVVQ